MGGEYLLTLNINPSPIAHKYREGKMQRTLKRELKVLEIVKREAFEAPICSFFFIKSQRTPRKIQLIPRRGNARLFLWPGERAVKGPIQRGQGGRRGNLSFLLSRSLGKL